MTAPLHMHGAESLRHCALPPRPRSRRDVILLSRSPSRPAKAPCHCPAPHLQRDRSARPCVASHRNSQIKTVVRSKMADGSHVDRAGPKQLNDLTFSAPYTSFKRLGDSKKFSDETFNGSRVKLSFYRELDQSESSEKSDKDGGSVAATRAVFSSGSRKSTDGNASATDGDDRKKRCIDRYDSSESSDSGVAVLSPSGSGGSCSDIGEERSPYSPESGCSTSEEGTSGSSRMPPWASEPAPQPPPAEAPRRIAVQPAPVRRHNPHSHRRITEFFNHKMKPQNGLKRDHNPNTQDDPKKKYPKNGVTHELEKYISYLSHTFSPKVLMDVGRLNEVAARKPINLTFNGSSDTNTADSSSGNPSSTLVNGMGDHAMNKDSKERVHTTMNGFMEVRRGIDSFGKDKPQPNNGYKDNKKKGSDKRKLDPSANGVNKVSTSIPKGKVPIPALPMPSVNRSPIKLAAKPDNRMNGAVSSTTKLDSRMNGVMCGSNNLSLNPISHKLMPMKKNSPKKNMDSQTTKKTNRKSSACIANSKNLTWSKANNLKQKCINSNQRSSVKNTPAETNCKINIPNGIRQVPMAVNANLGNINLPMNNLQNCHQINIPQPCNGTTSNMASFVAVPQNMMLTALRIPQTGIQTQTLGQQNNMTAFNSQNVNVPSPTKLNGQFVFPLMQNINGTVVQIPNLMAKMPNFVLPQNAQLAAQRQDQLQNQTTQILINGTLLKLANAMPGPAYTSINKNGTINTQPTINKTVPGVPTVGMTVQQKPNYTVEFSHPVLVRQPGFFVTSVPNMNVKETWSCTGSPATSLPSSTMFPGTNASSMQSTCSDQMYPGSTTPSILTSSCSNPIFPGSTAASIQTSCSTQIYTASSATRLHSSYSDQILLQGPPLVSYTNQTIHTSSIPIAPVKPPDNPIQGTEPPSSTVKEPDMCEDTSSTKCDIPWLSKTVNNNIVSVQKSKKRRFAEVSSSFSDKFDELLLEIEKVDEIEEDLKMEDESDESRTDFVDDDMRKVEEVARREDTIFTQITVLKDVSSNVHSSLIEANFCNAATESESGIGTDKSIDSPSESLTSKEGDDDSCLSLSISLSSVEVQSQKSPILKQPKTLRFPPRVLTKAESKRASRSVTSGTSTVCLWENCKREFDGDPDLLEHIQSTHVETQAGRENYVCLWERCKVFGKPSCSRLWLERHTLSHGGSKPFKCIVDGCERRFSTQILLEKHVNNHFNESSPNASGPKKSADSASKLIRRNGKKLRYRRQPWSARMFDFFDAGMMEGLAWRLLRCTRWRLGGGCLLTEPARSRHVLTLHAALAATRYNALTMQREALITYYPPHVVEDEWVSEKDVNRVKRVEMASLPAHVKVTLYELFCDSYRKAAAPPPDKKQTRIPLVPTRLLPARNCASSRLLNNLIAKQRQSIEVKADLKRGECNAPSAPMLLKEADRSDRVEVSGAKKRKLGRRYGGNAFWPCGR